MCPTSSDPAFRGSADAAPFVWIIDGNNVMGSRPDGWWHDRVRGALRLTQQIAEWCRTHDDRVVLVFDGRDQPAVTRLGGGNLRVEYAPGKRDAADDRIVALLTAGGADDDDTPSAAGGSTRVVTADKGLIARLPDRVAVLGPGRFLELIGTRTIRRA